jgi:CHAD domain-containing protein
MLSKKKQKRYLDKRWRAARHHLYAFAGAGSEESLHGLRVELKKIKAWLRFAGASQPAVVKKMFRVAGAIRDAQIAQKLMKQYHVHDDGHATLQQQQEDAGKLRTHTLEYARLLRKARKRIKVYKVRDKEVRHWVMKQLQIIARMLASAQYHPARKKIKVLLYIHNMLPKRLQRQFALDTDYLDKLQDSIGNWHDASEFLLHQHRPMPENDLPRQTADFPDKVFNLR